MEQQLLAESDARPIIDLAAARLAEGWSVFTCAVTAERTGTRLYGGLGGLEISDGGPS